MPRAKTYEREELLRRAHGVFHRRGYRGASTAMLVKALRVNRSSVYAEFGSKEGLFVAVLETYCRDFVARLFGPLESPAAGLEEIENLFRQFAEAAAEADGSGCLMCNTAAELGGQSAGLRPLVEAHFTRVQGAFRRALEGAVRRGQVQANLDVESEAHCLAACCSGIFLMVRAALPVTGTRAAISGVLLRSAALRRQADAVAGRDYMMGAK